MNRTQIQIDTLKILTTIAPEVEADTLIPAVPLRNQVDLDSMDWLNFLIGVHKHFAVEIPEADYLTLITLDDVVNYVAARVAT